MVESSRPGELLAADTYYVGKVNGIGGIGGIGKVYLHTVVDPYGSYAFGFLHPSKLPAAALAALHNEVLPFYAERGLQVSAILTDNGREFCGTAAHPDELYLALNDLEHRRTKVRHPQTNGFVERFQLTIKEEFFGVTLRETVYESVAALQAALDTWLTYYNTERPHLGYRNQGRRPIDTLSLFTQPVSHEGY
jgi:transposase InsO family protein